MPVHSGVCLSWPQKSILPGEDYYPQHSVETEVEETSQGPHSQAEVSLGFEPRPVSSKGLIHMVPVGPRGDSRISTVSQLTVNFS